MQLFHKLIRAIERNSRANERRKLSRELDELYAAHLQGNHRAAQIVARLMVLGKADLNSYLHRNKPVKSVAQSVAEDDCGVPDGLVGEWKGPA